MVAGCDKRVIHRPTSRMEKLGEGGRRGHHNIFEFYVRILGMRKSANSACELGIIPLSAVSVNSRDFAIYDGAVNENSTKQ